MVKLALKYKIQCSLLVFITAAFFQYFVLSEVSFSLSIIGNIVTFLSILFGFYITSLAIFVTSRYVSTLYQVTDEENKSQTLLHTLTDNYQFGLLLTLLSLIYFITVQFFLYNPDNVMVSFGDLPLLPILGLLVLDFMYCYIMLTDLIKIIIQEGKGQYIKD